MDFNVTSRNGNTINVPDFAKLNIDGYEIIGDQTTDWNEPIQKNFLVADKKVKLVELSIAQEITDRQDAVNSALIELSNEATARQNADTAIQTALSTESTARQSAISNLQTSVQTYADNSANAALLSAKTYTDSEVSKIINGASEALDTFKEIEDKFSTDENGVISLIATVSAKADLIYVDGKDTIILEDAKSYADSKASSALIAAKSYMDSANAVSASKLATARTIAISGDVSGSVLFDGSANVSITATISTTAANITALIS